jgi:hypothetical protein
VTIAEEIERAECRHCGGTGLEPGLTEAQAALLAELREAGERRAKYSTARSTIGRLSLDEAYRDIRVLAAEADRLQLTKVQVAEAVGVKRAALYNILTGKAGG